MKLKLIDRMQEQARIFGKMNRCTQTIEECAELTKELCKYQRITNNDKTCSSTIIQTLEHIAEEIADVEICTCQLKHLFDIKNKVDEIKEQRLKEEQNKD
jgi:NTP pyrophosphatase (non-canonical NTP hydrolase)